MGRTYSGLFSYGNLVATRSIPAVPGGMAGPPSDFPNPFRPAEAANYMPLAGLVPELEVDATLYRRRPGALDNPWLDVNTVQPHNNADRCAQFRKQARQRLANMVTTRSSVFAIWVTIGFFEIDADDIDGDGDRTELRTIVVGGTEQGFELGSDNGNIKRHRAFYIVDRSIPVGFSPGRNHNVDRMILVESILE